MRAWRGFDGHTCVRPSRGEPLLRRVGWPCHERADQLQEDLSWQLGQRQLSRCTHSSTARSDADAQRQLGVVVAAPAVVCNVVCNVCARGEVTIFYYAITEHDYGTVYLATTTTITTTNRPRIQLQLRIR